MQATIEGIYRNDKLNSQKYSVMCAKAHASSELFFHWVL